MKRRALISLLAVGSTGALTKTAHAGQRLTVLELFTSQGCSSCPPADRVLGKLSRRPDILALSFHVDYWNYIGWKDPFSSKKWSQRQRQYNRALRSGTYTPQLIVDGRAEMVGSRGRSVLSAVSKARSRSAGPSQLDLRVDAKSSHVDVHVKTGTRRGRVLVAVLQEKHVTEVGAGENGGETLENHSIVRTMRSLFDASKASQASVSIPIDRAWQGPLKIAVLQQDAKSMGMLDAAAVSVSRS